MRRFWKSFVEIALDERGGEVLEYALIVGIIVAAAIALIAAIGGKSLVRWTSLKCNL